MDKPSGNHTERREGCHDAAFTDARNKEIGHKIPSPARCNQNDVEQITKTLDKDMLRGEFSA